MNDNAKNMAEIINETAFLQAHKINGDKNLCEIVATALDAAGYRKQSETAKEFAERLLKRFGLNARKESEDKHEKMLADYLIKCVNEVAASFGVGLSHEY